MKKTSKLISAVSASVLCSLSFSSFAAPSVIPDAPSLSAKGYVLMDYHTGRVLVEHNANEKLNPASLTKLMTSYVAGQEMKQGNISKDDVIVISRNAWARNFHDSSKMFIEVGAEVPMMDLFRGLIIQSGNDASVAIAEHVAGSQDAFVGLMNSWAKKLNMNNSRFANAHGLDHDDLYSTPYDIALLGQALIRDLPDIYPLYSEKSFTYNNITQRNRNGLLHDSSMNVDGMKTGYTSGAGYSLASSATEGDMRLIAVVMGTKSPKIRQAESKQLLNYGFRFFDTVSPHKAGDEIMIERIWMGDKEQVKLGVAETSYVTLSRNNVKKMTASVEMTGQLEAPIEKGQQVGKVIYSVDGKDVASQPLVALETVNEGSFFSKIIDMVKKFVYGLFN
ncbi:D-alanyl-D-alanine carboxypeptidase [Photobacterium damselae subsp. piscicida]|uniref:serine-type D-Ala-D-Ala carboxypeptidase n=2 Tax=Photobacterium damselae TaxID=38293 RepID=A0A1Q9H530_PHODP|nr:D-alanyl-D-alanine carboxypeptidase family protein [Photobacterium damselae]MBE8129324.1 D-alanyl-D-alanine carboxypeptidase [Photobacterium damselae subsp. piscicida]MDP2532828.1 D-alanyl-D-alanine carboxypeptidase family protein [Photobacterium damselae subsp. piscicida]MDP2545763.1 D-alanyl-D-alanine carboxypeptidase family protein [Photobacterium damselae subsp. piscicida]MDP2558884.1 D-alanyl-D-alanine carboxypeptidase family protein [Photobacterium damselae subsp. piscicida]MDP2569670